MQSRMMVLMRPGEETQLSKFAGELWHDAYDGLLGGAQVDHMMRTIQSEEAIRRQIEKENYIYFFLFFEGARAGYCALKPEEEKLFLSKLYLSEKFRGQGAGAARPAGSCRLRAQAGAEERVPDREQAQRARHPRV